MSEKKCSTCQHAKVLKGNSEYFLCNAPLPEPLEPETLYVKPDEGTSCRCHFPFPVDMHLSAAIPHHRGCPTSSPNPI